MLRRVVACCCVAALVVLGGCGGDEGSAEELCTAVRADPSVTSAFAGFDPSDPEKALDQLRTARVTLGNLRDAAPGSVRDDIDVEIDYVQALIDGLGTVDDGDATAAVEVVRQVTADHPKVADASAALGAYSQEHCGS